MLISFISF